MSKAKYLEWTYEDIISDKSKANYMLTVLLTQTLLNEADTNPHIDICSKIGESKIQRKVYVKLKDSIDVINRLTQQAQDGTLAEKDLVTKLRYACNGLMTAVNSAVGIRDTKIAFKQVR